MQSYPLLQQIQQGLTQFCAQHYRQMPLNIAIASLTALNSELKPLKQHSTSVLISLLKSGIEDKCLGRANRIKHHVRLFCCFPEAENHHHDGLITTDAQMLQATSNLTDALTLFFMHSPELNGLIYQRVNNIIIHYQPANLTSMPIGISSAQLKAYLTLEFTQPITMELTELES